MKATARHVQKAKHEATNLWRSVFKKGSFAQNFAFTFSGNAIGILSQIIFAPILSRVYGPEAYGVFSLFNALATNLSLVATLRLEGAIILPKTDEEFERVVKSIILIPGVFSGFVFLATIFAKNAIETFFGIEQLGNLLYWLGPYVYLICFAQITANWVVRKKAFREALVFGTPIGVTTKIFNVFYGWLTHGASNGLVLTETIAHAVGIFVRFKYIIKINAAFFLRPVSFTTVKETLSRYKQFPLYDLPGSWVNMFSAQLPIYMLSYSFGAGPVGQLGFAASLLDIPMRLLGNATSPVFLQKATQTYHEQPQELTRITVELYSKLLYLGLLPFTVLTVFGDVIFIWIFGAKWEQAGLFTGFLGLFYLFRLISAPLSSLFIVANQQSKYFRFQIFLLFGRLVSLWVGLLVMKSINVGILLFGIFNTVAYLILSSWILIFVKAPVVRLSIRTLVLIIISYLSVFGIREIFF